MSQATEVAYRLLGSVGQGQVGAALVSHPNGHQSILTQCGADPVEIRRTAELMELARAADVPCPRYEAIVEVTGTTLILQQRLPGAPPIDISTQLVQSMIDLNERMVGLLSDRMDTPVPSLHLLSSGAGFCLHESLAAYDGRTRRLLDWVHEVGREHGEQVPGTDLVHLDYHPGNILVDPNATITGLVDWDGIGRGDSHLALVTLLFDLAWRTRFANGPTDLQPGSVSLVNERLRSCDPIRRRMFWAHMSLRQVDWAIRHHSSAEVTHYLDFAQTNTD